MILLDTMAERTSRFAHRSFRFSAVSKTQFVSHKGQGFWAYDVALGVLLKHLVDVAEPLVGAPDTAWLKEAVYSWRLAAVLHGLQIEDAWSAEQKAIVIELVGQACDVLQQREKIPADEITAWPIIDDLRIFPRGAKEVYTAPVVELGRAIVDLIHGTLPEAPVGTWWCFGTPAGRTTIKKREPG